MKEKVPEKKRGGLTRLALKLTKSGREKLKKEDNHAEWRQRTEKERMAHTEGLEMQIPRLHSLNHALATITIDNEKTRNLARFLAHKLQEKGIPKISTMSEEEKSRYVEEAKRYIFTGILEPYKVERHNGKDVQKPLVNKENMIRHLAVYLAWRDAQKAWLTKGPVRSWGIFKKTEKEIETASMPKFMEAFTLWHEEQKRRKPGSGTTRPPTIPDANLVVSLAQRLEENDLEWQLDPPRDTKA